MTSRRTVSTEKTVLDKDDMSSRGPAGQAPPDILPGTIPQISKTVISKLLAYTIAMIVAPLSAYFLTLNHIYNGMQFTPIVPVYEMLGTETNLTLAASFVA
ncbi:hypothetical protein BGX38DRAFT_1164275 [Terfezia claveryi]|nr:hypothetical protein BGX38DRAFT_1164275 [Terfezia claveryi]